MARRPGHTEWREHDSRPLDWLARTRNTSPRNRWSFFRRAVDVVVVIFCKIRRQIRCDANDVLVSLEDGGHLLHRGFLRLLRRYDHARAVRQGNRGVKDD